MPRCVSIWRFAEDGCNGFLYSLVFGGSGGGGIADMAASFEAPQDRSQTVSFADVFRVPRDQFRQASPPGSHLVVRSAHADDPAAGAAVCEPLHPPLRRRVQR